MAAQTLDKIQPGPVHGMLRGDHIQYCNSALVVDDANELTQHLQRIREIGEGICAGDELKTLTGIRKLLHIPDG
jgi:hypothetical protein